MKDYKKLLVWQKGIDICKVTYELTSSIPAFEKYGIVSQMNRAAVSIPSNIAEGSSRKSEKDYFRFLEIALGSCFELETQCVILREIQLVQNDLIEKLHTLLDEEAMMLQSLMKKMNVY